MVKKPLWPLFLTFLKIGAFTCGGGYAMIPLLQREVAEEKKWISPQDMLDVVAIAESTPGPIAINAATFIGYKTAGFAGAFLATMGVVLPSFGVIAVLSCVLRQVESMTAVRYAFAGIRAGVLALIVRALLSMYRQCPKGAVSLAIMGAAFIAVAVLGAPVLPVIIGCAVAGLVASAAAERKLKP